MSDVKHTEERTETHACDNERTETQASVILRVRTSGYYQEYESCGDCIHSGDKEEICKLRNCVHAINELSDCFVPKTEFDDDKKLLRDIKNGKGIPKI